MIEGRNDKDSYHLSGDLELETVSQSYETCMTEFRRSMPVKIDLGGVDSVDSSGLALLLELSAWAQRRNTRLAFFNAPPHLIKLAALCGADKALKLQTI